MADTEPEYFVARCDQCPGGPVEFVTDVERDAWSAAHAAATGHVVSRGRRLVDASAGPDVRVIVTSEYALVLLVDADGIANLVCHTGQSVAARALYRVADHLQGARCEGDRPSVVSR